MGVAGFLLEGFADVTPAPGFAHAGTGRPRRPGRGRTVGGHRREQVAEAVVGGEQRRDHAIATVSDRVEGREGGVDPIEPDVPIFAGDLGVFVEQCPGSLAPVSAVRAAGHGDVYVAARGHALAVVWGAQGDRLDALRRNDPNSLAAGTARDRALGKFALRVALAEDAAASSWFCDGHGRSP